MESRDHGAEAARRIDRLERSGGEKGDAEHAADDVLVASASLRTISGAAGRTRRTVVDGRADEADMLELIAALRETDATTDEADWVTEAAAGTVRPVP